MFWKDPSKNLRIEISAQPSEIATISEVSSDLKNSVGLSSQLKSLRKPKGSDHWVAEVSSKNDHTLNLNSVFSSLKIQLCHKSQPQDQLTPGNSRFNGAYLLQVRVMEGYEMTHKFQVQGSLLESSPLSGSTLTKLTVS